MKFINVLNLLQFMALILLTMINKMNRKQIDNLSKLCYDMTKLVLGIAVIGNIVSDKFYLKAILIGLITGIAFLFIGYMLDKKEVSKDDHDTD